MQTTRSGSASAAGAIAFALIIVPGALRAQAADEAAALKSPVSTFELGIGAVTKDNGRFGQYTGLRRDGLYGIGDLDLVRRDDATGIWTRALVEYEQPALDAAVHEELDAYVAARREQIGAGEP